MTATDPSLVALVTAGSAGLGAATARLFARSGLRVVVNYHANDDRAATLVEELKSLSPIAPPPSGGNENFIALKGDLAAREEIQTLVGQTIAAMGRLDVVFSNGGWTKLRDIWDLDDNLNEDDWDRCFNMNVKSHVWLLHASRKHLDETEGVFITSASLAGVQASGSSLPYAVTKAAQIHLVKALAKSVGPRIRVNCVSPSLMLTDWGKQFSQDKIDAMIQRSQIQRLVTVEDVAEQVLSFVRSKSITGANVVIDGGISI